MDEVLKGIPVFDLGPFDDEPYNAIKITDEVVRHMGLHSPLLIQEPRMPQTTVQLAQSNRLRCRNHTDGENPAGGYALGPGMSIVWQDGPRGKDADGKLAPANGAFVEDAIAAAIQRLEFFQASKYKCDANQTAIELLTDALQALQVRAVKRAERGVLGANVV